MLTVADETGLALFRTHPPSDTVLELCHGENTTERPLRR
jgi:hypothetical protein